MGCVYIVDSKVLAHAKGFSRIIVISGKTKRLKGKTMKNIMQQRAILAAANYFERKGYIVLDATEQFVVAVDDGSLVFAGVDYTDADNGFPKEFARSEFEFFATDWLMGNFDFGIRNMPIRFDFVAMQVLSGNNAFVRHHINCLNKAD